MMYSNKFVISVLVNGQVQKEFANGEVNLPFDTEYAIRFRNKNDRQAVVKLFIDGEKMCRGGFVIPANTYRDIECSSQTLRKFKFVDLQSNEAQDHGKDQSNSEKKMGLLEAHWYLEKARPVVKEIHHHHNHPVPYPVPSPIWPRPRPYEPYFCCRDSAPAGNSADATTTDFDAGESIKSSDAAPAAPYAGGNAQRRAFAGRQGPLKEYAASSSAANFVECSRKVSDGATVEGAHSNQRFGECNVDIEETATVLKLYLRGYHAKAEHERFDEPPVAQEQVAPMDNPAAIDLEGSYCRRCGTKVERKKSNFCHVCGIKLGHD